MPDPCPESRTHTSRRRVATSGRPSNSPNTAPSRSARPLLPRACGLLCSQRAASHPADATALTAAAVTPQLCEVADRQAGAMVIDEILTFLWRRYSQAVLVEKDVGVSLTYRV